MSYIYTVKPIEEAIKIAVEQNLFYSVNEDGRISIYGIFAENWPADVRIRSTKRITNNSIHNVGPNGFVVPLVFFTETTENDVPEFIKNLYDVMTASCVNVSCEDCPLHRATRDIDSSCSDLINWTKKRWSLL